MCLHSPKLVTRSHVLLDCIMPMLTHILHLDHNKDYLIGRILIIMVFYIIIYLLPFESFFAIVYIYIYTHIDIYIYIYTEREREKDHTKIMMSVLGKGCKKTKDHNEFGLNNNGSQYKTCMKCRDNKLKEEPKEEPKEELPNCCDVEEIRNSSKL